MIHLRSVDFTIDDDYDACGNTTYAVLEGNGIKILLCEDCLNNLLNSVDEFNVTTFCNECSHFEMFSSGFRYGGHCKVHDKYVESMGTCQQSSIVK